MAAAPGRVETGWGPFDFRSDRAPAEGEAIETVFLGHAVEGRVRPQRGALVARFHPDQPIETGQKIGVSVRPEEVALLPA